ncbi:2994_t:CDS:1, partial [Gigaspora margarita]
PVDRGFIIRNSTRISATPFITNGFGPEYRIAGTELPDTQGAIVCKSGYHSEVNCGTLFAIFGNLIHADGTSHDNVIIVEDMECVRGDSGGPVFTVDEFTSNVNLVGMAFGGIIENNINYCYVHPVSAILLEGME